MEAISERKGGARQEKAAKTITLDNAITNTDVGCNPEIPFVFNDLNILA